MLHRVRSHFLAIALSGVFLNAGCSSTATDQTPSVAASIEQSSVERQQVEEKWKQTKEAFAQAASVDKFMMRHAASVDDTKAWAIVADTHNEWANDNLSEFASNVEKSCVPTVTDAFDKTGSRMIQYGQDLGRSTDPKAIKLSPALVEYGANLGNMKSICEKTAQQIKEAQDEEAAASSRATTLATTESAPSSTESSHPYAMAVGQIIGLTLATALVGGLLLLDYEAARHAAAPTFIQTTPSHCTSYQTGAYTQTNCY